MLAAEMLLLHQLRKLHALLNMKAKDKDPEQAQNEAKQAKEDLGKLVTKLSVFFTENIFGIEASAVEGALWTESQKFAV